MIPANYQIFGKKYNLSFPIQPEYQAVLDRASFLGITLPGTEQQRLDNNVIYYLKQIGIWTELDLLYMFKRHSSESEFSKINWINPNSFFLTTPVSPAFESGLGWASTTGGFFDTGYRPSVHHNKFNIGDMSVFCKNYGTSGISAWGCRNSSASNLWGGSGNVYLLGSTSSNGLNVGQTNTRLHIKEGTTHRSYVDGNIGPSNTYSNGTLPSVSLCLFALNNNGTIINTAVANTVKLEFFGLGSKVLESHQNDIYKILNHIY